MKRIVVYQNEAFDEMRNRLFCAAEKRKGSLAERWIAAGADPNATSQLILLCLSEDARQLSVQPAQRIGGKEKPFLDIGADFKNGVKRACIWEPTQKGVDRLSAEVYLRNRTIEVWNRRMHIRSALGKALLQKHRPVAAGVRPHSALKRHRSLGSRARLAAEKLTQLGIGDSRFNATFNQCYLDDCDAILLHNTLEDLLGYQTPMLSSEQRAQICDESYWTCCLILLRTCEQLMLLRLDETLKNLVGVGGDVSNYVKTEETLLEALHRLSARYPETKYADALKNELNALEAMMYTLFQGKGNVYSVEGSTFRADGNQPFPHALGTAVYTVLERGTLRYAIGQLAEGKSLGVVDGIYPPPFSSSMVRIYADAQLERSLNEQLEDYGFLFYLLRERGKRAIAYSEESKAIRYGYLARLQPLLAQYDVEFCDEASNIPSPPAEVTNEMVTAFLSKATELTEESNACHFNDFSEGFAWSLRVEQEVIARQYYRILADWLLSSNPQLATDCIAGIMPRLEPDARKAMLERLYTILSDLQDEQRIDTLLSLLPQNDETDVRRELLTYRRTGDSKTLERLLERYRSLGESQLAEQIELGGDIAEAAIDYGSYPLAESIINDLLLERETTYREAQSFASPLISNAKLSMRRAQYEEAEKSLVEAEKCLGDKRSVLHNELTLQRALCQLHGGLTLSVVNLDEHVPLTQNQKVILAIIKCEMDTELYVLPQQRAWLTGTNTNELDYERDLQDIQSVCNRKDIAPTLRISALIAYARLLLHDDAVHTEKLCDKAIHMAEALGDEAQLLAARVLWLESIAYLQWSDAADKALKLASDYVTKLERLCLVFEDGVRECMAGDYLRLYQLCLGLNCERSEPTIARELYRLTLAYKNIAAELSVTRTFVRLLDFDSQYQGEVNEYMAVTRGLSALGELGGSRPLFLSEERELHRLRKRRLELETTLRTRIKDYLADNRIMRFTTEGIQQMLDGSCLLMEYAYLPSQYDFTEYGGDRRLPISEVMIGDAGESQIAKRYVRFSLRSNKLEMTRLCGVMTDEVLHSLYNQSAIASSALRPLYGMLLDGSGLRENDQTLYIVPDGDLDCLPFDMITLPSGGTEPRYLGLAYALRMLQSGRDMFFRSNTQQGGDAVVVANPAFGLDTEPGASVGEKRGLPQMVDIGLLRESMGGMRVPTLPYTELEASIVQENLRDAVVLSGNEATKSALLAQQKIRILHIASHGYYFRASHGDPMLRSGILLSGINDWIDGRVDASIGNGMLSAADMLMMPSLQSCNLVVLSCCNSGLGDVGSSGLLGIRMALAAAGVKNTLYTLYSIPDGLPVVLLIKFFYEAYQRYLDAGFALREARQQMRDVTYVSLFANQEKYRSADYLSKQGIFSLEDAKALDAISEHSPFDSPVYWASLMLGWRA